MKNKINTRLVLIAILAVITTMLGTTLVYYSLFQKQVKEDLTISAKLLKDTRYFELENIDVDEIDLSTNLEELRVTWIGQDGTVLYDNDANAYELTNHMDRPEIIKAFSSGEGESLRNSNTMNQNTLYYAIMLDNGTVLRVARNVRSIWSLFISVLPIIMLIIMLIIVICITISRILTKQLIKPIEIMAENLEDEEYASPYKELDPLSYKLKSQHADVLKAIKARQDFTANISHELKTPLTAISGYAELLEGDMVASEQRNHFYMEIRKNANRLLSLINDIIRLSELDRKENKVVFEELDLDEIVKECLDELVINAKSKNISLSYKGEKAIVRGNKEMLNEVVENLGQNAIKYNNQNGNVEISVKTNNGQSLLIVKDDGIGIAANEQDRIFERFYRVDKSRSKANGGTGLGLAIVKHIIEIHDAKIEVQSKLNQGTTMTVIFN